MRRLLRNLAPRFSRAVPSDRARFRPLPGHPVEVQIVGRNSIDVLNVRDISMTGIGVRVPHRFEGCDIDSEVELVITLPQERAFVARGRIRHETHRAAGSAFFGVQFTQLSYEHVRRLRSYVASGLVAAIE